MATTSVSIETAAGLRPQPAWRLVLFLTVFIDLLGFGIVIPFLPMFAARVGVGAIGIGMALAVYSFTQLFCAPLLGRISDRIGRRPVIMVGLAGSALGYLIYGAATSFFWLILSRALHGACASTVSTAQAYIADITDDSERARGMGLIGAAFGLGFVLGPAVGGFMGRGSLRIPAFFAAGLSVVNVVFAGFWLTESHPARPAAKPDLKAIAEPLRELPANLSRLTRSHLIGLFSLAFCFTTAFAAMEATFALAAERVYGFGPAEVGGILALAGLVQAIVQGFFLGSLADRFGEERLIRAGAVAMALGLFPVGTWQAHGALWIAIPFAVAGYGLASPSVASMISRRATRRSQGEALGINQAAMSLARIVGPVAGGSAFRFIGPGGPFLGAALVTILAIALIDTGKSAAER